jgi:sterol O-acyltransferase
VSQLSQRKETLAQKLKELDDIETTDSTAESVVVATGISTSDRSTSHIDHHPNLNARTVTEPHLDKSRVGAIMNIIDHGSEGVDESTVEIFREVIRSELDAIDKQLNGKVKHHTTKFYPHNLTFSNWFDFTMLPTLIYELEYPRRSHIDWWYVAEKTAATLGGIWVMIVISQSFIYPHVLETFHMKESGMTLSERFVEFPWVVSDLLFPILLEQLLAWYVIWECVLNVIAELTMFADRDFYGRWWNSVSWDQYARDWNRPVHDFLLRHVYNSSISSFHLSKQSATFVTFLLSALVHELLMWCLFKKVRGYLFIMQLSQIPLAMLSRTKLLKGRKLAGNLLFWFGLYVGPSILASLYLVT